MLFINMRASTAIAERRERPSGDDLVADILVDFAACLGDGERQVGDETVEEVQKMHFAEASLNGAGCVRACFSPMTASPRAAPPTSAILAAAPIFAPGFIAVRSSLGSLAILRRRSRWSATP